MHLPSYRIDLEVIPRKYEWMPLLPVSRNSEMMLRKQVERFASYFRSEFHYDFLQYSAAEKASYSAYLFANPQNHFPRTWVGACCFRERTSGNRKWQALQWIWIHPFSRNRGVLKENWPALKKYHGNFAVEPPLSPAMEHFLFKYNNLGCGSSGTDKAVHLAVS